jgi:hypothetical protein
VYARHVDSSASVFSLSSHRLILAFLIHNKQTIGNWPSFHHWKDTSGLWLQEVPARYDGRPSLYLYHSFGCQKRTTTGRIRGRYCGDIDVVTYLTNTEGPVSLVLDLHIDHDQFGSSSDLNLNGHLHYPKDIDRSLNETVTDKVRKYRSDYNNSPPNDTSFMTCITSTSGSLHSEIVRLLFLQNHRETDRFFAVSGVQLAHSTSWTLPLPPYGVLLGP